jgi:hypothetical protein
MAQPSAAWREQVAADEEERFARYAVDLAELQRRKSARFGPGRALHRKQVLGLAGRLEVLPGLPDHCRHGLFAAPGTHPAWVRLSNGSADRAPDRRPDVRGFAVKVLGVRGPGALGGETTAQDFLLINHAVFAFPRSDEFVELVLAAGKGGGALLAHVLRRYGLLGGARFLARFARSLGRPFSGFATERFHSAAPIACGPYAARVRLLPASSTAVPGAAEDWAADVARRLSAGDLAFDLQLQFFTDERVTPIEDASVDWLESEAPYQTVARLVVARRDDADPADEELQRRIEGAVFDPWQALAAHRPLGDVMRARKVVYHASQKGRGAVLGVLLALAVTAMACTPAASPPPPPPEPGPQAGTIVVEAQPAGVEVMADGAVRCRAPCSFRIDPGLHRLSIRKVGYMPWQENVEVQPNAEVKVSAALVGSH